MTTRETLTSLLVQAMREKQSETAAMIRTLISAIQNKEIEFRAEGKEMTDADVCDVLAKEQKKRNESALVYTQGGREDLAHNEEREAQFIAQFLPKPFSPEEIEALVQEVLSAHGEITMKDFGVVVKEVMAKAQGRADGSRVSECIKKHING